MRVYLYHNIIRHPQPENAGTITINAKIDGYNSTFTGSSFAEEFFDEYDGQCRSKEDLNYFLMESGIDDDDTEYAISELLLYVFDVILPRCSNYNPSADLLVVSLLLSPNNSSLRPASKLVVKSLARKIYKKTSSTNERCAICLEEFNDGRRVVTLPCGHDFDDECALKWFETNHDCPLCRFKLLCKVVFNDFLVDSELFNEDDIESAFFELILYISRVTYPATGNYSPGDDLLVSLLLFPDDDPIEEEDEIEEEVSIEEQDQIDEAVRVSLEETTNISLMRPASKLVVNSLARKTTSSTGERCTICLEEFNDGRRVVTLPCGHEFDDECVLTWFETNHDCPLCRFKLPCGDQ
ncbi:unnamed protein product [Arabidopsis arenosa]|uniref:RING-type domain-containing protein n=1 Tax=Arabidopsis arenosa TaxID=38785 RepID=A0A8S1ZEI6_ARAAE|nr:unnamed protein product [Arabidopsis arenosa]